MKNSEPEKTFKLAFGETRYGIKLTIRDLSFEELALFCSVPEQGAKHDVWMLRGGDVKHVESYTTRKGVKHGPGYYRTNEYLLSACLLIIDGDSSTDNPKSAPPPKLVHRYLKSKNVKHFIYTSHSHSKTVNKFRVVIPCSMDKSQCLPTSQKIIQELNDFGVPVKWVREMGVWAQIWYLPTRDDPTDELFEYYEHLAGEDYVPVDSLDKPGTATTESNTGSLTYEEHIDEMFRTGEGHIHYAPAAQALANMGQNAKQIFKTLNPICKAAFNIHKRNWNDEREQNLLEAAESGVVKVEGEKAASNPRIEVYEHPGDDNSIASTMGRLSDHIVAPDDLYGELVRAIRKTFFIPNIMSSHIAADGIIAHLAGGKYSGKYKKDRVNIYELGSGDTACGKGPIVEAPTDVIQTVFCTDPAKAMELLAGVRPKFGSHQAIENRFIKLKGRPDILLTWDELGLAITDASQRNGSPNAGIMDFMLEFWPVSHQQRQKRDLVKDDDQEISYYAPHLTVIGAGTETSIIKGLNKSFISNGNLSRILMYPVELYKEEPVISPSELELSGELIANLRELSMAPTPKNGMTAERSRVDKPIKVNWGEDVDRYIHKVAVQVSKMPGGIEKDLWNRAAPNIKKKAMIRALLSDPVNPVVSVECVEWARLLIKHSCDYQLRMFSDGVGENKTDTALKKCIARMKKANGKPVVQRDLHKLYAMQDLTPYEKKQVLDDLVDTWGYERIGKANVRGKETIIYVEKGSIDENN